MNLIFILVMWVGYAIVCVGLHRMSDLLVKTGLTTIVIGGFLLALSTIFI